jgi:hypothetical protein
MGFPFDEQSQKSAQMLAAADGTARALGFGVTGHFLTGHRSDPMEGKKAKAHGVAVPRVR